MSSDDSKLLVIGIGVLGGAALGKAAIDHMFVEGLTARERKGIFKGVASGLAFFGMLKLYELHRAWYTQYATTQGVLDEAGSRLNQAVK